MTQLNGELANFLDNAIAIGYAYKMAGLNMFGRVLGVANGVESTVWRAGDTGVSPKDVNPTFPTAAMTTLKIISDDAEDGGGAGGDTGALTVIVKGIDSVTGLYKEQEITMDGLTEVDIPGSWAFVNRAQVLTAGSALTNVGRLSIYEGTLALTNVRAVIAGPDPGVTGSVGRGQTEQLVMQVPFDKWGVVKIIKASLESNNAIASSIRIRRMTGDVDGVYNPFDYGAVQCKWSDVGVSGSPNPFAIGRLIPPGAQFEMRVTAQTGANVAAYLGGYAVEIPFEDQAPLFARMAASMNGGL